MPLSNAPLGCIAFVGFGSDTDCDGTSYYVCGVFAADLDSAWSALQEDFGGMTYEGINEVVSRSEAISRDIDVDKLMAQTYDNPFFNEETNQWEKDTTPFRYQSTGASWNPWVYDDSLGTVLDHTLDD